jgi:hypothetical protein
MDEFQSRGIEIVHHGLPYTHDGGYDRQSNAGQQEALFHAAGSGVIQNYGTYPFHGALLFFGPMVPLKVKLHGLSLTKKPRSMHDAGTNRVFSDWGRP